MKYQQGDVIIKAVEGIPKNAKKLDHLILAEGETTGHSHQVVNGQAELLTSGEMMYLIVKSKTAEITHEEHKKQIIPKGAYVIGIVREWDYDTEEEGRVQD